jgi:hypothetical protein
VSNVGGGKPLVNTFLMASYLYYHRDIQPPISDAEYDQLCQDLLKYWKEIKHPHKKIIKRKHLKAGTGYYILDNQYPLMTKSAALCWVNYGEQNERVI